MRTLLALAVAACAPVSGAPVPRFAPAPVAPADLVGTWCYRWGSMTDGSITLLPDGTYHSRHVAEPLAPQHVGAWWWDGARLTLRESRVSDGLVAQWSNTYEVPLARTAGGALAGWYGTTPVALCDRSR